MVDNHLTILRMIIHGDCLEELKKLEENSVDSIVTDPPYGLEFMGKEWDKGVPGVPFWLEMMRVLKPGGHLLSFGGSRTYHRIAVAIEDAGFEIRDQIMWVYGSGFPKSLNIGKAVDKLQGNERKEKEGGAIASGLGGDRMDGGKANPNYKHTKGTSEWEGWGTALKPSFEPIVVARKPLSEKTVAENVLKWGTGGINIDGCRVEVSNSEKKHFENEWDGEQSMSAELGGVAMNKGLKAISLRENVPTGRFPANFIHDGSDEVVGLFPNDTQRFFYTAKASKSERNRGCEGLEEKEQKITNQYEMPRKDGSIKEIPSPRKNSHPTVKPLALMQYLVRLVTPPKGVCLDPFLGSGTTGVACKLEGFDFIGIEKEEEYVKIAEARISNIVAQETLM